MALSNSIVLVKTPFRERPLTAGGVDVTIRHRPDTTAMPATPTNAPDHPDSSRPPAWWRQQTALARYVADLLAAEFAAARPGRPAAAIAPDGALDLTADLGADSLDLQALATSLAEALHLHAAGGASRL